MPIWSLPADQTTAREIKNNLGGNMVHFAMDPNPRNIIHVDQNGNPEQHDRAFVTDMPNVSASEFKRIVQDAIAAASKAAIAVQRRNGSGSTGTIALYDPKTFTLEIASKGDSPVFVLVEDGKKLVAVKVADGQDDSTPEHPQMTNSLNHYNKPVREGTYQIKHNPRYTGTIDLRKLIDEVLATREEKMNTERLKVHVLIASDGLLKSGLGNVFGNNAQSRVVADHYDSAKRHLNKSRGIIESAMKGNPRVEHSGATDNLSVIFLEDIRQGKGDHPIAAAICDGFKQHGGEAANAAIDAMENVILKEITQANLDTPSVAGAYHRRPAAFIPGSPPTS